MLAAVAELVKLKLWVGNLKASLISLRVLSIFSSRFSTMSGIFHPKEFEPASVLSTWWSSSSPENRCLPT